VSTKIGCGISQYFFHPFEHQPAGTMEEWEVTERKEKRRCFLGNIFFLQFDKRAQRGKNTLYIHKVGIALDAVAPMVFAKITSKKFIDMAGQKNVD
jgi:hypothetical protein